MRWLLATLAVTLLVFGGCKDEESETAAAPAEPAEDKKRDGDKKDADEAKKPLTFDMKSLQFALAPPWTSRYDGFLQSWVWSKTPDPAKPHPGADLGAQDAEEGSRRDRHGVSGTG